MFNCITNSSFRKIVKFDNAVKSLSSQKCYLLLRYWTASDCEGAFTVLCFAMKQLGPQAAPEPVCSDVKSFFQLCLITVLLLLGRAAESLSCSDSTKPMWHLGLLPVLFPWTGPAAGPLDTLSMTAFWCPPNTRHTNTIKPDLYVQHSILHYIKYRQKKMLKQILKSEILQ